MMSKKQLLLAVGSAALLGAGQASAVLVHEWNFNNGTANDSVGNADLTLNGAASISGGNLVLTNSGGAPRTENAQALGASLAELAATINGTDQLTIVVRYNATANQAWSKTIMAGSPGDSWIDITPQRGGTGTSGITFQDGVNGVTDLQGQNPVIEAGNDVILIGVWDEVNGVMQHWASNQDANNALSFGETAIGGDPDQLSLANIFVDEFYLGSAVGFNDPDFNGAIDSVQIYDNAFTVADVTALTGQRILTADTDGDGDVDDFDLLTAISEFTGSLTPTSNVPEPASVALLGLGGLLLGRRRRA